MKKVHNDNDDNDNEDDDDDTRPGLIIVRDGRYSVADKKSQMDVWLLISFFSNKDESFAIKHPT